MFVAKPTELHWQFPWATPKYTIRKTVKWNWFLQLKARVEFLYVKESSWFYLSASILFSQFRLQYMSRSNKPKHRPLRGVSTKHWPPVNWLPTDPLLTPLLTPYKINEKMKMKKPKTVSMGPDSSSPINLAYLNWNFQDSGRVADFRLPSHLTEGFVTENRAQNNLEYQKTW